jgi:branched-chain amino acid transport system substrate-binding protein
MLTQNPPTLLLSDKVGPALKLVPESPKVAQGAASSWVAISIFCLIGFASLAILIPLSQEIIRSPWNDELRSNLPTLHGLREPDDQNNTQEESSETSGNSESILTVRIGHVAPTSGVIGHLGQDNEYGARMAIEELNSSGLKIGSRPVKFELLAEDDAANPSQGLAVAQKLVNARVNGVIGHLNSGTTIPASQIYNSAGIPQISPSATNPKYTRQGYSGAFRLVADDAQLGATLGRIAVQNLEGKSIAVIDDRTAYGAGIAEAFKNGVTAAGGTIVAHEFTSDKASDFFSLLNSIREKNPDIVFFGGMDDVAASILRQMKRLGIQANFIGGDGICTSQLAELAGNAVIDDSVFCAEAGGVEGSRKAAIDKFRRDFKVKYNSDVQVYAPYVYDAVKVMASAMVTAGSAEPAIYLPALKAINYKGVTGDIAFDNKGDVKNAALTIYTYRQGARIQLDVIR